MKTSHLIRGALVVLVVAVSLMPTHSDACSYIDPCTAIQSTEVLGAGTVVLDSGDEQADMPEFLEERAELVFDGAGRLVAIQFDTRSFELEVVP